MSADILSQTLFSITNVKLEQLQKQKNDYEAAKRALLAKAADIQDPRARAQYLVEESPKLPVMTRLDSSFALDLNSLARFINQAEFDPCVSEDFLSEYEKAVTTELDVQSNKYGFASLYGKLVNEWIAGGRKEASSEDSEFLPVGREEMHKQRQQWEDYVFKPKVTDEEKIRVYLDSVFSNPSKEVKAQLETTREALKTFQKNWSRSHKFTERILTTCINGMLRSDTLTDEKRTTLRDFLGNNVVLSEIADVLNVRLSARKTWNWGNPINIEQKRNLNGRYRFYPDEDLLQAIFLHYVGLSWCVRIRRELTAFLPFIWKDATVPTTRDDQRRREYFFGDTRSNHTTIEEMKKRNFVDQIFLDHLPSQMDERRGAYGDDDEQEDDTKESHVSVTQQLLHRIATEVIVQTKLGKDVTVIRSDYKWFGPSIPHSTIFAILRYFGVNDEWLDFFRRSIEAPLRFKSDPEDAPIQKRSRGTPIGTPLADFFGEVVLFCGDFAVRQRADGGRLYRLHDDMWLWGDTDTCVKSWKALEEFVGVVGLELNLDKTGSVQICADSSTSSSAVPAGLPEGPVSWGFLKLDKDTGRFLIDQADVDKHIEELRLQLDACRSILDWIHAWNLYGGRFFATNFGKPAQCYGRAHVDSMLSTFRRIQSRLFPDCPGGVGQKLKRMIAARSDGEVTEADIPDGYLYFPVGFGGLGLQNPFIPLLLVRDDLDVDPAKRMDEFFEQEEIDYIRAKNAFEKSSATRRGDKWNNKKYQDLWDAPFPSLEEYTRYRERTSTALPDVYQTLLQEPNESQMQVVGGAAAIMGRSWNSGSSAQEYDHWVLQLFHRDMVKRFGGLEIVDKGLLPTGMIEMLKTRRFAWSG